VKKTKLKYIAVFAIISFVCFLAFSILRQVPFGNDTYAFVQISCTGGNALLGTRMPLAIPFFQLLPCNYLVWNALCAFVMWLVMIVVGLIGEQFNAKHGWLAGLAMFGNALFLSQSFAIEDVLLATPFVFLSFYFAIRLAKERKWFWFIGMLASFLIALGFWKGSALFLPVIAFLTAGTLSFVIAIAFVLLLSGTYLFLGILGFFNGQLVQENLSGFGLIHNWVLLLGFANIEAMLLLPTIWLGFLAFMAQKYTLFLAPFLAIFVINYLEKMPDGWKVFATIMVLGIAVLSFMSIPTLFPNPNQMKAINEVIQLADGNKILDSFGYGWALLYFGGLPDKVAGYPNSDFNHSKGYALVYGEDTTCETLKTFDGNLLIQYCDN